MTLDNSQAIKQQPPQNRYQRNTHKSRIFSLHSGEWKPTQRSRQAMETYSNLFDNDLSKRYRRKLESDEKPSTGWILPEHGVINPNKPGKLRRVSEAQSKFKEICLNGMLLTGHDLLCNLLGVITRLREPKQSITSDIERMYMQVSVKAEDRKFIRFLWERKNPIV